MDARRADEYWRAINVIEAREALLALKISLAPHMKKEGREKFEDNLNREAYPKKSYLNLDELKAQLARKG